MIICQYLLAVETAGIGIVVAIVVFIDSHPNVQSICKSFEISQSSTSDDVVLENVVRYLINIRLKIAAFETCVTVANVGKCHECMTAREIQIIMQFHDR